MINDFEIRNNYNGYWIFSKQTNKYLYHNGTIHNGAVGDYSDRFDAGWYMTYQEAENVLVKYQMSGGKTMSRDKCTIENEITEHESKIIHLREELASLDKINNVKLGDVFSIQGDYSGGPYDVMVCCNGSDGLYGVTCLTKGDEGTWLITNEAHTRIKLIEILNERKAKYLGHFSDLYKKV